MKKILYIATSNKHKTKELSQMLANKHFEIRDLSSLLNYVPPEETGKSFIENAALKANALKLYLLENHSDFFRDNLIYVLADDSGLECDDLGGAPGIFSVRFAGPKATDAENNAKLIAEIQAVPHPTRRARFVCALVLLTPEHQGLHIQETCEGEILLTPHGKNGFGYDPLFYVEGLGKTMAELDDATKNKISHRSQALHKLLDIL